MMRVRMIYIADDACGYYRIILPARALKEGGMQVVLGGYSEPLGASGVSTVIFQRYYGEVALGTKMRELRARGIKVVYDLDDDLLNIPEQHPDHGLMNNASFLRRIRDSVTQANIVTCSTVGLAHELKKYNAVVKVIPNCVDQALLPKVSPPTATIRNKQLIGFAGTCTHHEDLMMVFPAVERILAEYPNVNLFMLGYAPPAYKALNSRLGGSRLTELPGTDYFKYLAAIRKYAWDVGIVPLVAQKFNESKSVAKFLEYTLSGVPVVASSVGEYRTLPRDVAVFCETCDDWYRALKEQVTSVAAKYPYLRRALDFVHDCRTIRSMRGSWEAVCRGVV